MNWVEDIEVYKDIFICTPLLHVLKNIHFAFNFNSKLDFHLSWNSIVWYECIPK